MTIIKINKGAIMRKGRHVYHHDDIIYKTLREMRRLSMTLVEYDESGSEQTILKFKKKG